MAARRWGRYVNRWTTPTALLPALPVVPSASSMRNRLISRFEAAFDEGCCPSAVINGVQ
jgi:hypothetical protein